MSDAPQTLTGFDTPDSDGTSVLPGTPQTASPAALSNPKADLAAMEELERHLYAHRYAQRGMSSYATTIDPQTATDDRAEALAILQEEDQALLCSPETGALLERLTAAQALLNPIQAAQVRILRRDRERLVNVPAEVQSDFTRLTSQATDAWARAKRNNDWGVFEPFLDRIVTQLREIAAFRNPSCDPYDVWLDEFEHDTNHDFYDRFFAQVKDVVVPLLADVKHSRRRQERSPFDGRFDVGRQWDLARDLMRLEGIDESKVFLTSTEHPFSNSLTSNYAIIAGHMHENDLLSGVYTILHEGGHALYDMGVDRRFDRTSLQGGTSMGMHESQSRFFENYIGRSQAFAPRLVEVMARHFRGQLGRATQGQFYAAVNRVKAQPIRTEADELTYPLHVLVRYEIEKLLLSGEATAADVPRLWAELYRSYLGITVPNDTLGALQDVHWADGAFGYFPTYALGSAFGAQFRASMLREGMDFDGICRAGDLTPIHSWLRNRIWSHGRSLDSTELILDACGEPFSPSYYTSYLTEKFSALYGL